ncbi:MAG: hypothetical protein K2L27_08145 [Muribaculaceae bacterium]|nr:hypothetical protein [Muribaculaceae bacterium]
MKIEIRHRRLYAFFRSKVLNALMIVVILSLLLMAYTQQILLPAICGATAFAFFAGYSFWFWIKKPERIIINHRLSDINGLFTLYFLIVSATPAPSQWWYIAPAAFAVVILFILLAKSYDEAFAIQPSAPQ